LIGLLLLTAALAPLLAPYDPTSQNLDNRFAPPGSVGHPLGTDDFGRDVLSRIVYGSRSAILVGLISVGIAMGLGTVVGVLAGYARGPVEQGLMLLTDGVLSFPTVLLAITVVSVFGYGLGQVMVALGIIFSPLFARTARAETLAIRAEPFMEASDALGTPAWKSMTMHLLPNMLPKLIVLASTTFALAVGIEASLSFLGLGIQPPDPSWGLMLTDARDYIFRAPWLAVFPGIAIGLTVLSFNLLGDTLAEGLEPRSR
jgi:ABC-type dipeptide/oligopeptide/nickel transport system permease subunit